MAKRESKLWNDGRSKGGIRQRSTGSWEITVELPRDPLTGRRRQETVTVKCSRFRQAHEARARLLSEIAAGARQEPTRLTVAEFLDRWDKDYVAQNLRPKTAEGYRSVIKNRLKPQIGSVILQRLTAGQIVQMYQRLKEHGRLRKDRGGRLSGYSMVNTHRILKEALGHAVKWGLLRFNPAGGVDAPKVQKAEMRTLSEDETIRLLGAATASPISALVQTLVFTGMRRSELLGLHWGDIDLDLATIQVRRGLHALRGGTLRYEEPKSRQSRRRLDLPPLAVAALRRHRQQMEDLAAELHLQITDETPVFCRRDLTPMLPDSVSHQFEAVTEKAGLGSLGLHVLRHTHATHMLKQGIHPKVVQERLGHSSIQVTLDLYSHVAPGMQQAAALSFEAGLLRAGLDRRSLSSRP